MLFFGRKPVSPEPHKELRGSQRYAVGSAFPLEAVLNLVGRDEDGELLKTPDGRGWDWKGRPINVSKAGVSLQLPLATFAVRGDSCLLKLFLGGHQFIIPGRVANLRRLSDSVVFGLKLDFADGECADAYSQLIELVALGASLKPNMAAQPQADGTGYVVEHFHGDRGAQLTVWRGAASKTIDWFEYQLTECCVRGDVRSRTVEFTVGGPASGRKPASGEERREIHRLFCWVVPNLARAVPADIRQTLQQFAAEISSASEQARTRVAS